MSHATLGLKGKNLLMYEIEKYVNGMTTIDSVFDKMCDFEELYLSYLEARKGKRYRDEILRYTDNLEENLLIIQNELIWEMYKVGKYNMFYVTEPKLRLVMSIQFKDRIVQWAIYRQLNPLYDKTFINDSYACRVGRGSHAAAERLQYWLRQVNRREIENGVRYYYLKLDISKYFYRVNHEILLNILSVRIKDERLLRLLRTIINCETQKFGLPVGMSPEACTYDLWLDDVGMPIGNLTSQLFANIYLDQLDKFCKHGLHTHYYIRYMDDVIILSDDKEELHRIRNEIQNFLTEALQLDLNKKTAIRPISLGINFVGYQIWATHRKLKKSTARKIIRRVSVLCKELANGEITREDFDRHAASYKGMMEHCDSLGLRTKLNDIFQQAFEIKERGKEECTTQ